MSESGKFNDGFDYDQNELHKPLAYFLGQVVNRTFCAFSDHVEESSANDVITHTLDLVLADEREMRLSTVNGVAAASIHSHSSGPWVLELTLYQQQADAVLEKCGSLLNDNASETSKILAGTVVEATMLDIDYLEKAIIGSKPANS